MKTPTNIKRSVSSSFNTYEKFEREVELSIIKRFDTFYKLYVNNRYETKDKSTTERVRFRNKGIKM